MKRIFIFSLLMIAFVMNAVAQWNVNPKIKETHWFGQYEYVDIEPGFVQRKINWSGNYIESTEIWRSSTGGGDLAHQPKTSYYSWLENELRFSVENPEAWKIRGTTNTAYNPKGFRDFDTDGECGGGGGQGLKNISGTNQNFYIHNLEAGDSYDVRYYVDGGSSESHITGTATGTATVSIPANAVIRNVVITLAEYVTSDFKVEEVSDVSDITSSYAQYRNMQTSEFGTLGYKYSFKGPGVLEDKRGAAPYITMKFGNDNDMTFVRKVSSHSISSGSETINHVPGQQGIQVYAKNRGQQDPSQPTAAYLGDNYYYQVTNDPNNASNNPNDANNAWDCQFWIGSPELKNLPAGAVVTVHFRCNAGHAISAVAQAHGPNAGDYIYTDNLFTAEIAQGSWDVLEYTFTVSEAMAGTFQYIAFNLNDNSYNTFQFAEIQLVVPHTEEQQEGDEEYVAASIINEYNDLDPSDKHLQYTWTYKNNPNYSDPFDVTEIRDRFVGKEWSTFTAEEHPNQSAKPNEGSWWDGDEEYVYGDRFNSIWPLCGNFFYFFPEVDGLLEIEYYCEGANEVAAFWYKQKENGNYAGYGDQPNTQFINTNAQNNSNTNGNNDYKLRVNVEKGGIYYLCSLPTNLHQQPIVRLKSYTFIPRFRVAPLYKVVNNTNEISWNTSTKTGSVAKVAEITGGPYTNLDGTEHGYGTNSYDLADNTFERNAEEEPRIKCLGNVVSAKAKIDYEGGKQYLSFYDIKFREGTNAAGEAYNPGGAVVAHVDNSVGQASFVLTIAYDAANAKWNDDKTQRVASTTGGTEVKRWDFYSGKGDYNASGVINENWDLGKYGEENDIRYNPEEDDDSENNSAWHAKSKLFKETHKADGLTADWEYDWVDVPNKKEPIFKSIYDMEADNADMIHETAGLVFFTEPNELGIYNENPNPDAEKGYQDRFIGLMGGGKLIIPRLKAGDRVVIKMGCFGNVDGGGNEDFEQKAVLWLTNAKDAKGTVIPEETDYIIGGSMPYTGETQPHGEYHFIVNQTSSSDDTDFAIEVKEADLLKIYSIAIYRNAANSNKDILTENSVTTADGPELLFTDEDAEGTTKDMEFYLRYNGFEEPKAFGEFDNNYTRGNLSLTSESFSAGDKENSLKATFTKGDFGSFRADATVKTKDTGNTYVTDYAPGSLAIGNLEKMKYPYTWDFMDLLEIEHPGNMADEKYIDHAIQFEKGSTNLADDYKGWVDDEGVHCLRNAPMNESGILFANGGQLYAANKMFAETAGIGFKRSKDAPEEAKLMNRSLGIHSGSLELNADEGMFHKLVIPKVPKDAAIYVRATPIKNASLVAKYSVDGSTEKAFDHIIEIPMGDNKKDYAYIMKNDAQQNVELWLNGLSVQKIAVATDEKTVNEEGWNTESRDHAIDPSLLPFMTGIDFRTYAVFDTPTSDKGEYIIKLTRIDGVSTTDGDATETGNAMIIGPATKVENGETVADNGSPNACIVRKVDKNQKLFEKTVIKNEKEETVEYFHLFVPDMHDTGTSNMEDNLLKAQLSSTSESGVVPRTDEGNTFYNYAFTNKYRYVDESGDELKDRKGVYKGDQAFYLIMKNGASSAGNQAYLSLSSKVPDAARILLYIEGEEEENSEATGIATVENVVSDENVRFYNLNGQQLSGKPNRSGLYIVNGKKVYVKSK